MDGLRGGGPSASPALVPLGTEESLAWAEKIRPYVPYCAMIYNTLTLHGGGHASNGRFYVLQDRRNTAVVYYWGTFLPNEQRLSLFCTEEEVDQVIEALSSAAFVDWDKGLLIRNVPRYLLHPLQRLVEDKGTKMKNIPFISYAYEPHLDTQPQRVGPGHRVCLLGKAGIRRLLEEYESPYVGTTQLEMMNCLAQRAPYVGVYRDSSVTEETLVDANNLPVAGDEELPVAWVGTHLHGTVGCLKTDEGYRRRGFGTLLNNVAARRQVSLLKMIPHGFAEISNATGRAMHESQPCWKFTHEAFWMSNDDFGLENGNKQTVSKL